LDGFSLANHGWFAKFAILSPCQTFPLYGSDGNASNKLMHTKSVQSSTSHNNIKCSITDIL